MRHKVRVRLRLLAASAAVAFSLIASLPAEWPQFRGPDGQGRSQAQGLPLEWSESRNIVWKTEVPGKGWSSPVVSGGRIWLTTAADGGRSLRALSFDLESGRLLRNVEVFSLPRVSSIHSKNTHASPTPIVDGERVYVHFGPLGTAALTAGGEIVWKTRLRYEPGHGPGGSPALKDGLLIISCDGTDRQYVAALDVRDGSVRWTTGRGPSRMAFTTPLVIEHDGRRQVISPGGDRAVSYDLETGRPLWWIVYRGYSLVPRPVYGHGLVYITSGFHGPTLFAVRPDGSGDVTGSHVVWKTSRGVPLTPSPLLAGEELYFVSDNGIASCLNAKTGEFYWRERLGGNFSASPIFAGGRIYFLSEEGETTVIEPGREFKLLARNQIDGRTLASLAVADSSLLLRSHSHLYRIARQASEQAAR